VIKHGEDVICDMVIQWKGQNIEDTTWKMEFYIESLLTLEPPRED